MTGVIVAVALIPVAAVIGLWIYATVKASDRDT